MLNGISCTVKTTCCTLKFHILPLNTFKLPFWLCWYTPPAYTGPSLGSVWASHTLHRCSENWGGPEAHQKAQHKSPTHIYYSYSSALHWFTIHCGIGGMSEVKAMQRQWKDTAVMLYPQHASHTEANITTVKYMIKHRCLLHVICHQKSSMYNAVCMLLFQPSL